MAAMTPETAAKINTYICSQGIPRTAGEARSFLHHGLVVMGLRADRWGNYPLPADKAGDPRRIQFGDKVFRWQWRSASGWHNASSESLIEAALGLATKAAELTSDGFSCGKHGDCKIVSEIGAACSQGRVLAALKGKKAGREATAEKAGQRRKVESTTKNGPGFYVTNNYIGPSAERGRNRIADHDKPFRTVEQAIEFADRKFAELVGMKFTYLLPVVVIAASSRQVAEVPFMQDPGHAWVWWRDGKYIGPPVDPRQVRLPGLVAGSAR
jgi:hypothetical protein